MVLHFQCVIDVAISRVRQKSLNGIDEGIYNKTQLVVTRNVLLIFLPFFAYFIGSFLVKFQPTRAGFVCVCACACVCVGCGCVCVCVHVWGVDVCVCTCVCFQPGRCGRTTGRC